MGLGSTRYNLSGFGFYLAQDLGEWRQAGQLHQVEPGLIQDPAPWFGFYRVQIQGGSTYTHKQHSPSDEKGKEWREEEKEEEDCCGTFDEGEHFGV